jgi:hypothetical protein
MWDTDLGYNILRIVLPNLSGDLVTKTRPDWPLLRRVPMRICVGGNARGGEEDNSPKHNETTIDLFSEQTMVRRGS